MPLSKFLGGLLKKSWGALLMLGLLGLALTAVAADANPQGRTPDFSDPASLLSTYKLAAGDGDHGIRDLGAWDVVGVGRHLRRVGDGGLG